MDIELIKLLFDTGLFILIWIVQLVIYPSFHYYSEKQLKQWHSVYKVQISIVVLPLMVAQLGLYIYSVYIAASIPSVLMLALVGMIWLSTFLVSVPLHNKIENVVNTITYRKRLVTTNWIRTVLWTNILIISYINYAK